MSFKANVHRKKRMVISAFAVLLLIVALLGCCLVSRFKFNTLNPFSTASGIIQITFTDTEYVEIQRSPKVVLAQPNDALLTEFMEIRGFTEMADKRMGSLRFFSNGAKTELVMCHQNAYFTKWIWK